MNGQVALELYIREIETGFSGLELQTIVTCRSAEKKMQTTHLADVARLGRACRVA